MTSARPATTRTHLARPAGALLRVRWLVRAPIWIYRARLGAALGPRLLMLEHTGRISGHRRYAVLEVIAHPAPGTWIVISGFGTRAQWLRNVRARPAVRVWTGSRPPATATARLLSPAQGARALAAYRARHPRAWDALRPVLETTLGAQITDQGTSLPVIALDLAKQPG